MTSLCNLRVPCGPMCGPVRSPPHMPSTHRSLQVYFLLSAIFHFKTGLATAIEGCLLPTCIPTSLRRYSSRKKARPGAAGATRTCAGRHVPAQHNPACLCTNALCSNSSSLLFSHTLDVIDESAAERRSRRCIVAIHNYMAILSILSDVEGGEWQARPSQAAPARQALPAMTTSPGPRAGRMEKWAEGRWKRTHACAVQPRRSTVVSCTIRATQSLGRHIKALM